MKDTEVFAGKTLQNLLEDIYNNTKNKRMTILGVIKQLQEKMVNVESIMIFAPMIKDYLDIMVKNDDHLIKIATVVQRIISAEAYQNGGGDLSEILSDAEKAKLLSDAREELEEEIKILEKELLPTPVEPIALPAPTKTPESGNA
jgi:hypothetical protein